MSRQYKLSERRDSNNKKNENGFIFFNEVNSKHDLTHFEILHTGIDTLEQKYHGDFKSDVIDKLLFNVFDNGQFGTVKQLKDYPNEHHKINVLDSDLKLRLTRANGKESGYRYLLQNKAVGVFIFIGSFYDKEWLDNASIKVKFSPNLIYKEGVERCATIADELASHLMFVFNHAGVDGHLCKDFQGWAPEVDFLHNVKTRTRIKRALPSVGSLEGSLNLTHTELDFSDCAIRYNAEKSFLMGKKNSVQCALYSKMDEAKKSNKFKFWEEVYNEHMGYEKEKDVFRLEMRFPSTVLSNLGDKCKGGKGQIYGINSIKELIPHIPSLWKYALYDLFRYHYKDSNVVRPEWQLLADTPFNDLDYKPHTYQRVKITNTGTDSDKNISQMLGHLAAFMAKEGVTDYQAEQMLYNFPQRHILNSYFKQKGLNQEQWIQKFIEKVEDKRIDLGLVTESPFKFAQKYKNNEYEVPF